MKRNQLFTIGAFALMTALAPRINADDPAVKAEVDVKKPDVTVRTDTEHQRIRHSQKASGLIGMEVRNKENQKLGEIKDMVMDINSGKVSYAVLSVGGFLGIGEKLIALPPTALQTATDGEYLVLNADKAKIQASPGFAATAWPSMTDPEINKFWSDISATGAPAGTEQGVKGEVKVDTKGKIYTDADKDKKVNVEIKE